MSGGASARRPKRPPVGEGSPWLEVKVPQSVADFGYPVEAWLHRWSGYEVFSAVLSAADGGADPIGGDYFLSVKVQTPGGTRRISHDDALWVLRQFGMQDAKEADPLPNGIARNFTMASLT